MDVVGDIILVLDSNLQVQWAWDTFDHLDPHRLATLNETCAAVSGGCPPIRLAALANNWTHGNSVQLTPDGNILYSARHQDWVIKIDYRNGKGTGDILWRLGKDGDFQFLRAIRIRGSRISTTQTSTRAGSESVRQRQRPERSRPHRE